MRSAYRILGYLIALGVVVQAAVIAYAWFAVIGEIESGAVFDENSEGNVGHALHGMVGMMVLPALSLIFLILSFFAKIPGGVKWAAITFGLVVLQVVLAFVSFGTAAVGLLHGANAIAIGAVASAAASRVGKVTATAGTPEHELV